MQSLSLLLFGIGLALVTATSVPTPPTDTILMEFFQSELCEEAPTLSSGGPILAVQLRMIQILFQGNCIYWTNNIYDSGRNASKTSMNKETVP